MSVTWYAMRRKPFNFASALSLLLCVATVVMWFRSYSGGDVFSKIGPRGLEITSDRGWVWLWFYRGFPESLPWRWLSGGNSQRYWALQAYEYSGEAGRVSHYGIIRAGKGVTYYRQTAAPQGPQTAAWWIVGSVPHWLIALLTAVVPALWLRIAYQRARVRQQMRHGHCLTCGYDLTGNVSGRCPECGTAVPLAPRATE
jgi:hypothetical protein